MILIKIGFLDQLIFLIPDLKFIVVIKILQHPSNFITAFQIVSFLSAYYQFREKNLVQQPVLHLRLFIYTLYLIKTILEGNVLVILIVSYYFRSHLVTHLRKQKSAWQKNSLCLSRFDYYQDCSVYVPEICGEDYN